MCVKCLASVYFFIFVYLTPLQVITIGRHVKGYHYIIANLVSLNTLYYYYIILGFFKKNLTYNDVVNIKNQQLALCSVVCRVLLMEIYPKSSMAVPTCQAFRLLILKILWCPNLIRDGKPWKKRNTLVQTAK